MTPTGAATTRTCTTTSTYYDEYYEEEYYYDDYYYYDDGDWLGLDLWFGGLVIRAPLGSELAGVRRCLSAHVRVFV